jgi:hypothetical protein
VREGIAREDVTLIESDFSPEGGYAAAQKAARFEAAFHRSFLRERHHGGERAGALSTRRALPYRTKSP